MQGSSGQPIFRFGSFELDPAVYELRRDGCVVHLGGQPMQVLLLLVERGRTLVTREELAARLWPENVFVDRDAGLRTAILRIRQALGDTSASPQFVETVPGKGYRFVAPIAIISQADAASATERRAQRQSTALLADLTTFVGRARELSDLVQLIQTTRLLSLTGVGGSGKTRLARQAGLRVAPMFEHGVCFVDLAPLTDPELLTSVVARALDVPERPTETPADTLVKWLRPRHLLIILDNCEHLIDASATLIALLLREAPDLQILATSREALNVPGEVVWRVPPLTLPPGSEAMAPEAMLTFDAVRLFTERASAVTPFAVAPENAAAVADICHRLDGVPLAIELAAARIKVLSVHQIRERLDDRFRLLAAGGRTAVPRQRTLKAAVDWSYELLSDSERRMLVRLSVFSGGWTLEAAEAVCAGRGIAAGDVLDLLSRLVDKSLVIVDDTQLSNCRFRLLETIRQYAREQLLRAGEEREIADAHLNYYLALARDAEQKIVQHDQVAWLNRLDREHDNFRSAFNWAAGDGIRNLDALGLCATLWWFWLKRGHLKEGRRRLERALSSSQDVPAETEARALIGLVHLASFQGDAEGTRSLTAQALLAARRAGDEWAEAYALAYSAVNELERGEFIGARALASDARDTARRGVGPLAFQPMGLTWRLLGYCALQGGELYAAGSTFEEAVGFLRDAGEIWGLAILLSDLAALRVLEERYDDATVKATEALALCRTLRDRRGAGWCLQTLAMIDTTAGRARQAAWLYGAADALLRSVGATGQVTFARVQDHYLTVSRNALGAAAFSDAFDAGQRTSLQRIMEDDCPIGLPTLAQGNANAAP
jgi:predicted ATPase/DNA-binding winged helix-turn-helix (wHTH) protein